MKAGISNIWLLGMIAIFIFLFSCYIIISVNYTKSFKMKNEILNIIEKGKGITTGGSTSGSVTNAGTKGCKSSLDAGKTVTCNVPSFQTINIYLMGNAYTAKGYCTPKKGETWYGVKDLETISIDTITSSKKDTKYYYCFAKYRYGERTHLGDGKNRAYFYKVKLFYKMELPVIENWLSVKVEGDSAAIFDVQDGDKWKINEDAGYTT